MLGLPLDELRKVLADHDVSPNRANEIFARLHRQRTLDGLPERLTGLAHPGLRLTASHPADDGTTRLVFTLADGAQIESVLLPQRGRDRVTLCVSSQVGCAMKCAFCATGTLGLTRHLTAGEIVEQVYAADRLVTGRITHLVFMGMGEPLHNLDAVTAALEVLTAPHGRPIAKDRITVSTVGRLRELNALGERFGGRVQLAISLHAGTDATRQSIIPLARRVSMQQLREAIQAHPPRRLMVEYCVLPGVNDTEAEMDGLAAWVQDLSAIVNLIPFNPFRGSAFRSPTRAEVDTFADGLRDRGVRFSIRWPRGRQTNGACGQLMLEGTRVSEM